MILLRRFIEILALSLILLSCQGGGIKWDATVYVGDYVEGGIRGPQNEFIHATEPEFNNYACVSEEDFNELIEILSRARMPRRSKVKILDTMHSIGSQFNKP